MKTSRLLPDPDGLAAASRLLTESQLVAFPTETVYGLGADARSGSAVAAIYEAKGRPSFNPLIVHVGDLALAKEIGEWSDAADRLAQAFWPGPLTLVLPLRAKGIVSELVTAGLPSVAVRMPAHPTAQALLRGFGGPVAAPSANPSGRISSTSADHVMDGLSGRIAAVVDDGECPVGVESTIIGLTDAPRLLRPGGLPSEAIRAALGTELASATNDITAPGQLSSHYAPGASVRLNAHASKPGEVHLGFGPIAGDLSLSPSGDLHEAAANLFGHLHKLDAMNKPIAVAPVPENGLGLAINDRLRRAAAPRN